MDNDPLSVRLEDEELLEEIQLLTELILTATHLNGALDQATVDRVLGLSERRQMTQRPYDGTLTLTRTARHSRPSSDAPPLETARCAHAVSCAPTARRAHSGAEAACLDDELGERS